MITMIQKADVVVDENGVLGVVYEINESEELPIGVLFSDVDEDHGIWWNNEESLTKVDVSSKEYALFHRWYSEYISFFEKGIRPHRKILDKLYKKHFCCSITKNSINVRELDLPQGLLTEKQLEEKRLNVQFLKQEIMKLDSLKEKVDYTERNNLVKEMKKLQKDIPYSYQLDELVIVTMFRRPFKARVKKQIDLESKLVLVKPIDHIYKEEVILSEESLIPYNATTCQEFKIMN